MKYLIFIILLSFTNLQLISTIKTDSYLIRDLAKDYARSGNLKKTIETLALVDGTKHSDARAEILTLLSEHIYKNYEDKNCLIDSINSIQDIKFRDIVFSCISAFYARDNQRPVADKVISYIKQRRYKDITYREISRICAYGNDFKAALKYSETIEDSEIKTKCYSDLLFVFHSKNYEQSDKISQNKIIENIDYNNISFNSFDYLYFKLLFDIYFKSNILEIALDKTKEVIDLKLRDKFLLNICNTFIDNGKIEKALEVVDLIEEQKFKDGSLTTIASKFISDNNIKRAQELIENIKSDDNKNFVQKHLISWFCYNNKLKEALEITNQINNVEISDDQRYFIALFYLKNNDHEKVEEIIDLIQNSSLKEKLLNEIGKNN